MDTAARIARRIAVEIDAAPAQVRAAADLLDRGATVPFVARYRKEVTGGLDDTQLRTLADRLAYLRDMEARRAAILSSVAGQGKLTDDLSRAITGADTKAALEDIYLPFRTKRRTKASIARENGLEDLLRAIQGDRHADPALLAAAYVRNAVSDVKSALDGARDILVEELSENATLLGELRAFLRTEAFLTSRLVVGKEAAGAKFSDYFDHKEKWSAVPSHRALAILRAANEEIVTIDISPDADTGVLRAEGIVVRAMGRMGDMPGDRWLRQVAGWAWRGRLSNAMYADLLGDLRRRAHDEAIRVFGRNLRDLLLAAPAGPRIVIGLDPGIRTGVKVAVVDATGKLLDTATIYPFQPRNDIRGSEAALLHLIARYGADLIAIGNGTASRETDRLVADVLQRLPQGTKVPTRVIVSEAGASVYSASELAAREFPQLDVSLRGAVSIARRLQDPLAELVKVPPQSIGVGQYQHDVDQRQLAKTLEAVVEDAVNAVGVDLNMASAALLSHVAGLGPSLAQNIVAWRDEYGAFPSRMALKKVQGLGPRAFEQCAGFLRIRDGKEPLDASSVHPEAYGVARRIVAACGRDIRAIMGDGTALTGIAPDRFVDDKFGLPTVRDIIAELEKPGRDPRPGFVTATLADGVEHITDLLPGMSLQGTVTNVAAFGAFVDIGVHQDGLVHVSQLADRFVKDPADVVRVGDVVRVRVTEVDVSRKRIGLTMRAETDRVPEVNRTPRGKAPSQPAAAAGETGRQGSFGDVLSKAMHRP